MASAEYSVLTPERVSLQYDIAGIGSRGAAAIVDTLLQLVGTAVLFFALSATAAAAGGLLGLGGGPGALALLIGLFAFGVFVITGGYYALFEIIWNGQTPGKRLVGVRVIRENGYPIRPVDAVIRNLIRIVDWLPFFYAFGLVTMLLNNRSKRLGDFASGTIVVREGVSLARSVAIIPPPQTGLIDAPNVTLSNTDATLVRDFLTRRVSMNPLARAELARRLANVIRRRYGLAVGADADAERFLEALGA
jgi:uncharacterized RDD family membrane protein YckC